MYYSLSFVMFLVAGTSFFLESDVTELVALFASIILFALGEYEETK